MTANEWLDTIPGVRPTDQFIAADRRLVEDMIDRVLKATRPKPGVAGEWRDIVEAPRDGTELLLWPGIRKPVAAAVGAWLNTKGGPCWYDLSVGHHNGYWHPTHFMLMPEGPADALRNGEAGA